MGASEGTAGDPVVMIAPGARLGSLLGPSWGRLGAMLEVFWVVVDARKTETATTHVKAIRNRVGF